MIVKNIHSGDLTDIDLTDKVIVIDNTGVGTLLDREVKVPTYTLEDDRVK